MEYRISSKEVAERYNVTPRTAQRLAECGQLDAIKVGGQWRFNAEALPGMAETDERGGRNGNQHQRAGRAIRGAKAEA